MMVDHFKRYLRENWIVALFWVALGMGLYFVSMNIPLTADDFAYSMNRMTAEPLTNVFSVLESVAYEYQTWMGRLLCFFFAQLSYLSPRQLLFRLTFPLINCVTIYEMYVLISNRWKLTKKDLPGLLVLACLLYTISMKVLNQTLFWIIGYYTYFFPLVFLLVPVIYLSNILLHRDNSVLNRHSLILNVLSFMGCLFVEHYSIFVLVLAVSTCFYQFLRKEKVNKKVVSIMIGCALGTFIILSAPGILNRLDRNNSIISMGLKEQLYFGYTRFIYTMFSLNQPILLILSCVLFVKLLQIKKKISWVLALLLIPIIVISTILVLDLDFLLSADTKYFLMFEWSYYHWDRIGLIKTSWIVLYTLLMLLISMVYLSISEKSPFSFLIYCAAVCLQGIFIVTENACERTAFISSILFILLIAYYSLNSFSLKMLKLSSLFCSIILFSYLGSYCVNYFEQYQIYTKNDAALKACAANKECKQVYVDEHNYTYVFKSELDFTNQNNWVLNSLRTYYRLDDSVEILSSMKE